MNVRDVRWILPVAFLILVGAAPVAAQTPFAIQNIGQRLETDDARMVGRGFGMAVTDSMHPGFKNLASLSSLRHVVISFTGYGERAETVGTGGERSTFRTFTPEIRVGAPLIKNRLALTAGFKVYRSSQYHTQEDRTWEVWGETLTGNEQFVRDGSLFDVPLGAALRLIGNLSVAGSVNLVRGTLSESLGNFYREPSVGALGTPLYQPSLRVDEENYDGTSWTLAGLWAPGSGRLRFGASWTPAHDINTSRKLILDGVASRGHSEHVMHMPEEYRAGVQFRLFGRWHLGGDARYQDFREFTGLVTSERDWGADMGEEYGFSAGLERVRASERRRGWNNLPLRLAASYRHWGYTVGGEPIDQRTLSAGTGFPFRGNLGQLDLAVSWSTVGELAKNGYKSDIWRLTVSVVGLEEWW